MLKHIHIENYRILRNFDFSPKSGVNILVGDNEAGKSTLLEAVSLALTGKVNGRWAQDELNPFWFTKEVAKQFFAQLNEDRAKATPPEILIEVELKNDNGELSHLKGQVHTSESDTAGLRLHIHPDAQLASELQEYLAQPDLPPLIPVEFYICTWTSFKGERVGRQPKEISLAQIDSRTIRSTSGVDYYTRNLLREYVNPEESRSISIEHRKSRSAISSGLLSSISTKLTEDQKDLGLGLQMDQSSNSAWDSSVVPVINDLPFSMSGQGQQVRAKVELSLARNSSKQLILIEEPENHFSHTSLLSLLGRLQAISGQQLLVSTHSTYVLNRLGLDRLSLLYGGGVAQFGQLTSETVSFFRRLSGFNTLRVVLARKVVAVEGPSDEMIFKWAYQAKYSHSPESDGIDVISFGISGARVLELATALKRPIAVLRDNDRKPPEHWQSLVSEFLESGSRQMFVGAVEDGHTLEPQMADANQALLSEFSEAIGYPSDREKTDSSIVDWMKDNKTDWAWNLVSGSQTGVLTAPQYILDAAEFIHDVA